MTADGDIFDQIRTATAWVSREAEFVRLRDERIVPYATHLAADGLPDLVYDTAHHADAAERDTVAYLLALDSVNFGSGYFPHLRKRPGMSGYHTVAASLKDRWEEAGPLPADDLRQLDQDDCAQIFGQVGNPGPAQELMALFARALNDLGIWLARFDDDPLGPIETSGQSAARLVELAAEMPLYQDVSSYRYRDVPFFKRGQILVADLAIAFAGAGPGAFHDLERLTLFADNLVPHVLRVDGVLEYEPGLLTRIERGELIAAGSPEEVEIRAVAVHAVERIAGALQASGIATSARRLDYLLWNRGAGEIYKALPRHRTRTVYY
jgi:hypothetical protein